MLKRFLKQPCPYPPAHTHTHIHLHSYIQTRMPTHSCVCYALLTIFIQDMARRRRHITMSSLYRHKFVPTILLITVHTDSCMHMQHTHTHTQTNDTQSISCGEFWFAHVGGAQLNRHLGPRREFLVIGKGLLEAAECLEEASIGTLVVRPCLSLCVLIYGRC
jgi:hypothetical protein